MRKTWHRVQHLSNRLWVRLTLAFTLVALIGVLVNTSISLVISMQEIAELQGEDVFERDIMYQFTQPNGALEALEAYYLKHNSWDNIGDVIDIVISFNPPNEVYSTTMSFMDADGNLIYDRHPADLSIWPNILADETIPVSVNGEVTGYVRMVMATRITDLVVTESRNEYLVKWVEDWLRTRLVPMLLIGAGVGIIFAILVSRTMTAPLRRLAETAKAIGSYDLSRRVNIKGSTEVQELAGSFNKMAEELEHAEGLRRNLVADVAHELRTPLTVLQGNLRAILDGVYPLSQEEVAGLYDQTRVLSRLVKDLHEIAQAEAKKLPMHMDMLDLGELVTNVTPIFEPVAEGDEVQLIVNAQYGLTLHADYARLSQVLHNLLTNALYHTPAGGSITVRAFQSASMAILSVKDTGTGITAEHLPHVFERFYRADRSRSRNKGGTGLGLAISKAIVEAHGGQINVFSQGIEGQGTEFIVKLPLFVELASPVDTTSRPAVRVQPAT
ncbi:MAG: ATP-binding protein [Anaerolineae bacterium]